MKWFLLVLALASSAEAKPYVAIRGGVQTWLDTSNNDELEADRAPGYSVGVAAGDETGLSDVGLPKSNFALDIEVEMLFRRQPLHGRNSGEVHLSADDYSLDSASLSLNFWPGWQLSPEWTVFAGGGFGGGYMYALGDDAFVPFGQIGAGVRWNATPALSFELGQRTFWFGDASFKGYDSSYNAVPGLMLGVRWEAK